MASVAPDILRRMSSSADTCAAYGQRTPDYSHTPSAHSPAAAILAATGSLTGTTPTSPIFHQWRSVDELRAESAGDCRFTEPSNDGGAPFSAPAAERPRLTASASRSEPRAARRTTPLKTLTEEAHGSAAYDPDGGSEGATTNGRSSHRQPLPPITKCVVSFSHQSVWILLRAKVPRMLLCRNVTRWCQRRARSAGRM